MTCQILSTTVYLMPVLNQKGLAPIILIIILTVVIAGVAGVAYQSRKEIKVRSDKTSEVTQLKGTPQPTPKNELVNLANSGKLTDAPYKIDTEAASSAIPRFSFYPPAGWEKIAGKGNTAVEYLSSAEDKITEGDAWMSFQPGIVVRMIKLELTGLDDALKASIDDTRSSVTINQKQKIEVNGEEAYLVESTASIREEAQEVLEAQLKQELANAGKAGKDVSEKQLRADMEKVLSGAKTKSLSYIFYKNGYHITISGRALESFWGKREPQIKKSLDTFKFE